MILLCRFYHMLERVLLGRPTVFAKTFVDISVMFPIQDPVDALIEPVAPAMEAKPEPAKPSLPHFLLGHLNLRALSAKHSVGEKDGAVKPAPSSAGTARACADAPRSRRGRSR